MALVLNSSSISGLASVGGLSSPQTGSVLQVVQGSLAGKVTTASTSWTSTGLTASITPSSSSSKILAVVTCVCCYTSGSNREMSATLYRGATNLAPTGSTTNQAFAWLYAYNQITGGSLNFTYLDSPATTSSTTYTVYFSAAQAATVSINENATTSWIQLMEIAG